VRPGTQRDGSLVSPSRRVTRSADERSSRRAAPTANRGDDMETEARMRKLIAGIEDFRRREDGGISRDGGIGSRRGRTTTV
jgi:hypothetical protein